MTLLPNKIKEEFDRFLLMRKVMNLHLPSATNAPPSTGQTRVAKQRRLDRDRIEARHVLLRLGALDIEMVGLGDHACRIGNFAAAVQREI